MNNLNPFRKFRAEQMGTDLWKMYVPGPFEKFLGSRPLVLEGGRGSGKTMFFLCNSWNEKTKSLRSEGKSIETLLNEVEFVGLYYKVDTAFVTAMEEKNFDGWEGVFSTYLNVSFLKEAIEFIKELIDLEIITQKSVLDTFSILNTYLLEEDRREIKSVYEAVDICESILDDIEDFLNYPVLKRAKFKLSIIGRGLSKFVERLKKTEKLEDIRFRVFIDEYETFLEYQQRVVNTLIKHSSTALIYNIGMRPKGMLTSKTSGSNEIIQAPHDFTPLKPEIHFDPEGDNDTKQEFVSILKEICRLRLEKFKKITGFENIPTDIEFYLDKYDINYEIESILRSKKNVPFLKNFKKRIGEFESDKEQVEYYFKILGSEVSPLNARLHLCLLLRSERYRPSLDKLVKEYLDWRDGKSTRYDDWLHNTKYGLVFLLSREYEQKKLYYGFDVFTMLSTGVIRYFLELCEQAFDFALNNDFDWNKPRKLTPQEQSKAARYVSRYKVNDVKSYEPYGKYLKMFLQNIGDVFRELHRSQLTTLGEPEINHFYTKDHNLDEQEEKVLNSAIMWGVIQERDATKEKVSDLPIESVDYHLNRIYCPYFEISYRRKRKLYMDKEDLTAFLLGQDDKAKTAARRIIKSKLSNQDELIVEQLTLFDGVDSND